MEYKKGIIIASITSILVTLLLVFGISYAWINFNLFGSKKNTIIIGSLTVVLDDNLANGINLTNAYPILDTDGPKTSPYTFTVTNKSTRLDYIVKLINEGGKVNNAPETAIRYQFKKNNETPVMKLLSENPTRVLDTGQLLKGETNSYELRLWVDHEAGNEAQGKEFNGKIKVEINQSANALVDRVEPNLGPNGVIYQPVAGGVKYIRSATTTTEPHLVNNYVWWSGMMWRIYAINPDGSMKIITDDNVSALPFGTNTAYAPSYMKEWLETYFYPKLNSSKDIVLKQNNDFCIDSTSDVASARTSCTNKLSNLKLGLLTLDEYNIVKNGSVTNYLNNGTHYYTITPYHSGNGYAYLGGVWDSGGFMEAGPGGTYCVRVVTVFTSTPNISSGNGTLEFPYKIVEDVDSAVSGTKLNSRYTGEFISYDNKLWKIMETVGDLTKVIYDGSVPIPIIFGGNNLDWGTVKTSLDSIGISTTKIAQNQTWQRGYFYNGKNILITSLAAGNPVTSTFGLPRAGEIWASQNNNKTNNYAKFTAQDYWTMTPSSGNPDSEKPDAHSKTEWRIRKGGPLESWGATGSLGSRPVFFFKVDTTIASGDGMPNNPYVLQ